MINGTSIDEVTVREFIQRYKICWEVWPEEIYTNSHLEQTGFELELLGTHPDGIRNVSPGCVNRRGWGWIVITNSRLLYQRTRSSCSPMWCLTGSTPVLSATAEGTAEWPAIRSSSYREQCGQSARSLWRYQTHGRGSKSLTPRHQAGNPGCL